MNLYVKSTTFVNDLNGIVACFWAKCMLRGGYVKMPNANDSVRVYNVDV